MGRPSHFIARRVDRDFTVSRHRLNAAANEGRGKQQEEEKVSRILAGECVLSCPLQVSVSWCIDPVWYGIWHALDVFICSVDPRGREIQSGLCINITKLLPPLPMNEQVMVHIPDLFDPVWQMVRVLRRMNPTGIIFVTKGMG